MVPSATAGLSVAALLVKKPQQFTTSPVLFVLPLVQSFVQRDNRSEVDLGAHTPHAANMS